MASERLNIELSATDVSSGAFNSLNSNINKVEESTSQLTAKSVSGFKKMSGGVEGLARSISSGDIPGALKSVFNIVTTGLKAMKTEMILATAGIGVLIGAVILVAKRFAEVREDEKKASEEAIKQAEKEAAERLKIAQKLDEQLLDLAKKSEADKLISSANTKEMEIQDSADRLIAGLDKEAQIKIDAAKKEWDTKSKNDWAAYKKMQETTLKATEENTKAKVDIETRTSAASKKIQQQLDKDLKELDKKKSDDRKKEVDDLKKKEDEKTKKIQDASDKHSKLYLENIKNKENEQSALDRLHRRHTENVKAEIKLEEERAKKRKENIIEGIGIVKGATDVILSNSMAMFEREGDAKLQHLEKMQRLEMDALDISHSNDVNYTAQKTAMQAKHDKEKEKQIAETKKKERRHLLDLFYINKAAAMAQAYIETSLAAIKAFEVGGGIPFGAVLAGLTIAAGAVMQANIASQPPPFQTAQDQTRRVSGPSNRPMLATLHGGETVSRNSSAINVVINGNLYNEEQTYRVLTDGIRNYQRRSGTRINP